MPQLIKMSMNFNQQAQQVKQVRQVQAQSLSMVSSTKRNCMQLKFNGNKTCSSCRGKK
jgi:hypothetical protein